MQRITNFLFSAMLIGALTACGTVPATPTATTTEKPTITATDTPSPTATNTLVPPLQGRLFFDMNGSGLQDEVTFQYDPARLTNAKQPLQFDLLKAITVYGNAHPGIKKGDLITLQEPGLSGFTVCMLSQCTKTDADGNFSIVNPGNGFSIQITDPNSRTPALAMRYINLSRGPVTVPAYTTGVDAATMAVLASISGCENNSAQVCKQNSSTLLVRDQQLDDTELVSLEEGATLVAGDKNDIGLMQGFITYPFMAEQIPAPYAFNYFDIIGIHFWDDGGKNTFTSTKDGIILSYDGKYNHMFGPYIPGETPLPGVENAHTGFDFFLPIGTLILSSAPTSNVWYLVHQDGELRVDIMFADPSDQETDIQPIMAT